MSNNAINNEFRGTGTEDAFLRWINASQTMSMGEDTDDSNALKITDSTDPSSGNTLWKMTTAGERTMPRQPAFRAYAAAQANVTGNSALYTVLFSTEEYDQLPGHFVNPTFTAPVDGIYLFDISIGFTGITTCNNLAAFYLYNGAANKVIWQMNPAGIHVTGNIIVSGSLELQMLATETMVVQVQGSGQGANTVGIVAGPDRSWFSGRLVT